MKEKTYTMKEVCKITNISYDTLKYYCNIGLIPNVKRDKNNYRIFNDNNIGWINNLQCLKKCNMSLEEIKEYMGLCIIGKKTINRRKEILDKKEQELNNEIQKIKESIDFIHYKKKFYDDVLNNKIEYYSYLCNKK